MTRMTCFAATALAILTLTACGQTGLERTASGAAIGAAASEVVGGDAVTGAVLGGAAGATCERTGTCIDN